MGLDIDYVFAKQAIEELEQLVSSIHHGEREEIADDIIAFVDEMTEKYKH
jgi:hypothetical protein